jgi:ABC-type ATPase with predicted acetyltransferase domain
MKCKHCGEEIKANCDWRQGRCPHAPSLVDQIKQSTYYTRFYNLLKTIQGMFKRG